MAKWNAQVVVVPPELAYPELVSALRFYADAKNYISPDHEWETNPIEKDEGDKARAALRKVGAME